MNFIEFVTMVELTTVEHEKARQDKEMCKHKRLVFLGKQELLPEGFFLALFNCEDCRTTISLKMVKKNFKRPAERPQSAWAQ